MEPFRRLNAVVAPLPRPNVDTDQIIPKQFLKRIERTGFGEYAFYDWRFRPDGSLDPDFELNRSGYEKAEILVTGRNFGCGSSREHAPWALREMGFRVMIASSFADIFFNNSIQNGMLPIVLPEEQVQEIMERAQKRPGYKLSVNLESQTLYDSEGLEDVFEIDPSIKNRLLNGLDDIEVTLRSAPAISDFEEKRAAWLTPTSA